MAEQQAEEEEEQRRQVLVRRMLKRMMQRGMAMMFDTWVAFAEEMKHNRVVVARCGDL